MRFGIPINYFGGLPHKGVGAEMRRALTDFGSPWRGIMSISGELSRVIAKSAGGMHVTSSSFKKAITEAGKLAPELRKEAQQIYSGIRVAEKEGYRGASLIKKGLQEDMYQRYISKGVDPETAKVLARRKFRGVIAHERAHARDALSGYLSSKSEFAKKTGGLIGMTNKGYAGKTVNELAGEAVAFSEQYRHGLSYLNKSSAQNTVADVMWKSEMDRSFSVIKMNYQKVLSDISLPKQAYGLTGAQKNLIIENQINMARKKMSQSQHKKTANGIAASLTESRGSRRGNSGANG